MEFFLALDNFFSFYAEIFYIFFKKKNIEPNVMILYIRTIYVSSSVLQVTTKKKPMTTAQTINFCFLFMERK